MEPLLISVFSSFYLAVNGFLPTAITSSFVEIAPDPTQRVIICARRKLSFPASDHSPAIVIVAHTRKPKSDEKSSGRSLMHTLAGSYVLSSVPRSAFVLQPASDDTEDDRIVFTCCKNNDGELGGRSCWQRRNGLFVPAEIDWNEFDGKTESKRRSITEDDLRTVFNGGKSNLTLAHAAKELQELTGACRAAAYNALKMPGRFGHLIRENGDFLAWNGATV